MFMTKTAMLLKVAAEGERGSAIPGALATGALGAGAGVGAAYGAAPLLRADAKRLTGKAGKIDLSGVFDPKAMGQYNKLSEKAISRGDLARRIAGSTKAKVALGLGGAALGTGAYLLNRSRKN